MFIQQENDNRSFVEQSCAQDPGIFYSPSANIQTRRLLADKQISMAQKFDYSMGRLMSLKQRLIQNKERSRNALIQARSSQSNMQNRAALKKYFEHNKPMSKILSPPPTKTPKYSRNPQILLEPPANIEH